MSNGPRIVVDLVVISSLERLVAEEVDRRVGDTSSLLGLVLKMLQAVRLVPSGREHIEGDLATNGEAMSHKQTLSVSTPRGKEGGKGVHQIMAGLE